MTCQVEAPICKPDDPRSMSGPTWQKEEPTTCQVFSDLHTHTVAHAKMNTEMDRKLFVHTYTHVLKIFSKCLFALILLQTWCSAVQHQGTGGVNVWRKSSSHSQRTPLWFCSQMERKKHRRPLGLLYKCVGPIYKGNIFPT